MHLLDLTADLECRYLEPKRVTGNDRTPKFCITNAGEKRNFVVAILEFTQGQDRPNLCESLDLQLLIAAPEVARSEGNTTYRLVRKVTEDGREEVIVSGRRALGAEPLSVAPSVPVAVQGTLFEN